MALGVVTVDWGTFGIYKLGVRRLKRANWSGALFCRMDSGNAAVYINFFHTIFDVKKP